MLTLTYREEGAAPPEARRLTMLPRDEWEIFERESGIGLQFCADAETGERLWFHAVLTRDVDCGPILTDKGTSADEHLYLLPVVEAE